MPHQGGEVHLEPKEIFAKRLKELREEHQLSQEQLANKIDTKKQTLSRYERNLREPGINIITKVADFFGVSIDYLAGRKKGK
jgi:transcriptional regulator with XRE-family HTH domain